MILLFVLLLVSHDLRLWLFTITLYSFSIFLLTDVFNLDDTLVNELLAKSLSLFLLWLLCLRNPKTLLLELVFLFIFLLFLDLFFFSDLVELDLSDSILFFFDFPDSFLFLADTVLLFLSQLELLLSSLSNSRSCSTCSALLALLCFATCTCTCIFVIVVCSFDLCCRLIIFLLSLCLQLLLLCLG